MPSPDTTNTPADPPSAPTGWLRRITHHTPRTAAPPLPKKIGLRASISEFLLVSRLRARNMLGGRAASIAAEQAAVLTRFAHIMGVTCKHWFPQQPVNSRHHQRQL